MPFFMPIIVGSINVEVEVIEPDSGINRVEFYIDNELMETDIEPPYSWMWSKKTFSKHTIKTIAYSNLETKTPDELAVWKFF